MKWDIRSTQSDLLLFTCTRRELTKINKQSYEVGRRRNDANMETDKRITVYKTKQTPRL